MPACFRRSKTFGISHDLVQFLEQLNLLISQQLRITDHVYEQDVRDLEREIGLALNGCVLGVHP